MKGISELAGISTAVFILLVASVGAMVIQIESDGNRNFTNVTVYDLTTANNIDTAGSLWQPVYPSDDGLILYLPFSEGTGNKTYDKSPYGHDGDVGKFQNASWEKAKYGNGIRFFNSTGVGGTFADGGSYITINQDLSFKPRENITLMSWINIDGREKDKHSFIIGKRLGGGNNCSGFNSYTLRVERDGKPTFRICTNTSLEANATGFVIQNNTWYQITGVYNSTHVNLYIDGTLVNSTPLSGHINYTNDNLQIGALTNQQTFNWTVDEIRIYKRALSEDEIRTQYLHGLQSNNYILANSFKIFNTNWTELLKLSDNGNLNVSGTITATAILTNVQNVTVINTTSVFAQTVNASQFVNATTYYGSGSSLSGVIHPNDAATFASVTTTDLISALRTNWISDGGTGLIQFSKLGSSRDGFMDFDTHEFRWGEQGGAVELGNTIIGSFVTPIEALDVRGNVNISGFVNASGIWDTRINLLNAINRVNNTKVNLSGINAGLVQFTDLNATNNLEGENLFTNNILGRAVNADSSTNIIFPFVNVDFQNGVGTSVLYVDASGNALRSGSFNVSGFIHNKASHGKALEIIRTFGSPRTIFRVNTQSQKVTVRADDDTPTFSFAVNGSTALYTNLTVYNQIDSTGKFNISGITLFNESNRGWCVRVTGQGTLQATEGNC